MVCDCASSDPTLDVQWIGKSRIVKIAWNDFIGGANQMPKKRKRDEFDVQGRNEEKIMFYA